MSYRTILIEERSPRGGVHWLAIHPDLVGCHAIGREKEEALEELAAATENWLGTAKTHGGKIPPEDPFENIAIIYLPRPDHSLGVAGKDPVRTVRIPQRA